jgi:hypothetical protein
MDQRAENAGDPASDGSSREDPAGVTPEPRRFSRRDFAARFGAGSVAAVGVAWATPHVSTIKFAAKAAVGSPAPPGSSTTTTTVPGQPGTITLSSVVPCEGDVVRCRALGFAPRTAVTLELDSAEHVLGVTTASAQGKVNVSVRVPSGMSGDHVFKVIGVQLGGRTLTLDVPVHIKTQQECAVAPQGSTTTTTTAPGTTSTTTRGATSTSTPSSSTSVPTPTTVGALNEGGGGGGGGGGPASSGGFLAFTGTDSVDLALLGAAAAVGGRALFGLVAHRDDEDEDED